MTLSEIISQANYPEAVMLSEIQRTHTLNRYETFNIHARTEQGRIILHATELTIAELDRGAQLAETFKEARNQYQFAKARKKKARTTHETHHEEANRHVRLLRKHIVRCFKGRPDIIETFKLQPHFERNLADPQAESHERQKESLAEKRINWPDLIIRLRKLKGEDQNKMLSVIGGTENFIDEAEAKIQAFQTAYKSWLTSQNETSATKTARDQTWNTFNTWFANAATLTRRQIRAMRLPDPDTELKAFALKGRLRDPIR